MLCDSCGKEVDGDAHTVVDITTVVRPPTGKAIFGGRKYAVCSNCMDYIHLLSLGLDVCNKYDLSGTEIDRKEEILLLLSEAMDGAETAVEVIFEDAIQLCNDMNKGRVERNVSKEKGEQEGRINVTGIT